MKQGRHLEILTDKMSHRESSQMPVERENPQSSRSTTDHSGESDLLYDVKSPFVSSQGLQKDKIVFDISAGFVGITCPPKLFSSLSKTKVKLDFLIACQAALFEVRIVRGGVGGSFMCLQLCNH